MQGVQLSAHVSPTNLLVSLDLILSDKEAHIEFRHGAARPIVYNNRHINACTYDKDRLYVLYHCR